MRYCGRIFVSLHIVKEFFYLCLFNIKIYYFMKNLFLGFIFALSALACYSDVKADTTETTKAVVSTYSYTMTDNGDGSASFVIIDDIDGNIASVSPLSISQGSITSTGVTADNGIVVIDDVDGTFTMRLLIDGVDTFVITDDIDGA